MDALLYMSDMLSDTGKLFYLPDNNLWRLREFMKSVYFKDLPVYKQQALILNLRETASKVGKLIGVFVGHASRKQSSSSEIHDLVKEYREKIKNLIDSMIDEASHLMDYTGTKFGHYENIEAIFRRNENWLKQVDANLQSYKVKNIENMLLKEVDFSNPITLNYAESIALFQKKSFLDLFNMHNDHERRTLVYYKINTELGSLMDTVFQACSNQPLTVLLIGGLLSLKPITSNIWKRVKDDLDKIDEIPANDKIKEIPYRGSPSTQNNGQQHLKPMASENHMWHIITYCYNDLPYFLQQCFLYFACYPVGSEILATSLTQIWIAEGFVEEEDKQTSLETTANKYLDELVQRSLVFVSKRSFLGTIKSCRLPHSIHEFAIQQSYEEMFLVVNPDQEDSGSQFRLAIHHDNEEQYSTEVKIHHVNEEQYNTEVKIHHDNEEGYNTEVKNNHIRSFLAINFDRNVLGSAMLLKVLALRNSAIPVTTLPNLIYLRYLSLRGNNIFELPGNIGDMENLQTLDVRDTCIETLPKSLWNIKTLHHVYVKPSPQIKGPPSEAPIDNLHILKTVATHESWVKNIPQFLFHLTKLSLSNWDNLDWKPISNLFSCMDKLISMEIIGNIIPSEFADLRAFPNLETVKSIKLEGEWICRKLLIDNVKFPSNLTKLTLTKSGLKEDPMSTLERLQALEFLSLKDGAYKGKQMVCSANGFPKLQVLELEKLENLENWEVESVMDGSVKKMGIPQLTTLRVIQCLKLNNLPNLDHVTDKVIR